MDDYVNVSYAQLLNKCLNRCIIDWKCFGDRIVLESNKGNLRSALIQYCRGQREIFLKLKLLFDLVRYQKDVDRLLQGTTQYEQYLSRVNQDLSRNVCLIPSNVLPNPNVKLAVDLLSSLSYDRMPLMMDEICKSAVNNTVPIVKLNYDNIDLCLKRLEIHFLALFRTSECRDDTRVAFDNGVCNFVKDGFFHIQLLYDFSRYQLTRFKLLLADYPHSALVNVNAVNYVVNADLSGAASNNIFTVAHRVANNYVGRLLMKHLYRQALSYHGARHVVYQYEHATDPAELGDRAGADERLSLRCYAKYRHAGKTGVELRFTRHSNGDVDLEVPELHKAYRKIHELSLDRWLKRVSDELNDSQFARLRQLVDELAAEESRDASAVRNAARGDAAFRLLLGGTWPETGVPVLWMNRFNGALNLRGRPGEFSLDEAAAVLKLERLVGLLAARYRGHAPLEFDNFRALEAAYRNRACSMCDTDAQADHTGVDDAVRAALLGRNKHVLAERGGLHVVALYELGTRANQPARLALSVLCHNFVVVGNDVAVLSAAGGVLGLVTLRGALDDQLVDTLVEVLDKLLVLDFLFDPKFALDYYFVSSPFSANEDELTFSFEAQNAAVAFDRRLIFCRARVGGRQLALGAKDDAYAKIRRLYEAAG